MKKIRLRFSIADLMGLLITVSIGLFYFPTSGRKLRDTFELIVGVLLSIGIFMVVTLFLRCIKNSHQEKTRTGSVSDSGGQGQE